MMDCLDAEPQSPTVVEHMRLSTPDRQTAHDDANPDFTSMLERTTPKTAREVTDYMSSPCNDTDPGSSSDSEYMDTTTEKATSKKRKLPSSEQEKCEPKRIRKPLKSTAKMREAEMAAENHFELQINMTTGIEMVLEKYNADGSKRKKCRNKTTSDSQISSILQGLGTFQGLMGGSVLEEANVAASMQAQVLTTETDKTKALKEMVKNVPRKGKKQALKDSVKLRAALKELGRTRFQRTAEDGVNKWTYEGMRTPLLHHQVIGAAFMKEREKAESRPFGGILADAMGLGKTIETTCLMIAHPSPVRSKGSKCTLIVCPVNLIEQWQREVDKYVQGTALPRRIVLGTGAKLIGKGIPKQLEEADVVFATYTDVTSSYPKAGKPNNIQGLEDLNTYKREWAQQWENERGYLHRANFYRIVVDEAQNMKDHKSQLSLACRALMGRHRWALSGTPLMNSVNELYAYFKFLRVPEVGTYNQFVNAYCKLGDEDCEARLQYYLDQILLRRSHKDLMFGAPIISIPKNSMKTTTLTFSPVEEVIHYLLTKYTVKKLNEAAGNRDGVRRSEIALTSMARMRQMTSHVFEAHEILPEIMEPYHLNAIEESIGYEQVSKPDRDLLITLHRFLEHKKLERKTENGRQAVQAAHMNSQNLTELTAKFAEILDNLQEDKKFRELSKRTRCAKCGDEAEEAQLTNCLHIYCELCLSKQLKQSSAANFDPKACLACKSIIETFEPCQNLPQMNPKWVRQSQDKVQLEPETTQKKTPLDLKWASRNGQPILSTKLREVRRQVDEWLEEFPSDKIIVFSQWQMSMKILEDMAKMSGWGYAMFNAQTTMKKRVAVTDAFQTNDEIQVLIASLRCGGVGLNLTRANRIINVDLWFNKACEEQAFCRILRIGQLKESQIQRLVLDNSIDTRLEKMQIRKQHLIDAAIDMEEVLKKYSTEEIIGLLGPIRKDANRLFVKMKEDEKLENLFKKHASLDRKSG